MKIKRITILASVAVCFCGVLAQDYVVDAGSLYFSKDELPDGTVWLPAPPDTTDTRFVSDVMQYMCGKAMRQDSVRAGMAADHATVDIGEMAEYFSVPFGMEISEERTPAIFRVISRGVCTVRLSASRPKERYMRKRPYQRFNEPTLIPDEEDSHRMSGSYPSGHAVRGWTMALILCEINPDAQDGLLKLGYEWGESRVIAGYHWQSDVDASRMLAAAGYARLHTSTEYLEDIAAARREYAELCVRE